MEGRKEGVCVCVCVCVCVKDIRSNSDNRIKAIRKKKCVVVRLLMPKVGWRQPHVSALETVQGGARREHWEVQKMTEEEVCN